MFLNDPMTSRKCSARDFIFKEELGHGSYSTVYKAYDKRNIKRIFAIKVCSKAHIIKEEKVKYVTIEKNTLNLLAKGNHPGIVKLYYTFHDEQNLYFVLDFASGGELLSLLHKYGTFNETWSKHFTVQLLDTLDYIHSQGIIHRDLKPENVLLNKTGLLMITDFGAAMSTHCVDNKNNNSNDSIDEPVTSASSFVGTAEYVSPELLLHNQCSFGSDIWALGCMIFQFFEGHPPFRGENELKTFEKIVSLDYLWNGSQSVIDSRIKRGIPSVVISLVKMILVIDTKERLSLNNIKSNPWFSDVNWKDKRTIWKGIWEIEQDELSTKQSKGTLPNSNTNNVSTNFTSNSYHRMIPNRQLHVIDTPVKNIEITKQKKKKPTKVSNTTSSIVEWRKKLGISTTHINNKLQIVDMTTDIDNIGSDLIIPARLSVKSKINNNTNNSVKVNSNNTIDKQYSISQQHGVETNNNTNNIMNVAVSAEPNVKNGGITTLNKNSNSQTNNHKSTNSNRNDDLTQERTVEMNITTKSSQLPNQNVVWKSSTAQLKKSNIFKQGYVHLHQIPYKQNGPGMSLTSYHQIDNDLITTFITSHQNDLKSTNGDLNLLSLKKNGSLYYRSIQPMNITEIRTSDEHFMVNIGDSDLSVYDFEFDEVARSGFLILEKYKKSIWFISLVEFNELKNNQNINEQETWVDCFFTVRQLIEDQSNYDIDNHVCNITNKLDNVTLIDKGDSSKIRCTDTPISPTTSTKISTQLPSYAPKLNTKKTSSKVSSLSKNPSTFKSSSYSNKKKSSNTQINMTSNNIPSPITKVPKQRQASTNLPNRDNLNSDKLMTDIPSYSIDHNISTSPSVAHPISLPTTLRLNTNNTHKVPSSPVSSSSPLFSRMTVYENRKVLSPHFKAKSFMSSPSSNAHTSNNNHNSNSNAHYNILNSPTSNTKKYNAPKNMVITSSRYEVIHTLSNQSLSDQTVASSGASAAFKSLQRKKSDNNTQ